MITSSRIVAWMFIAIAVLGVIAYVDERNESAAALADFAGEQAMVARAATEAIAIALDRRAADSTEEAVLHDASIGLRSLEQPGSVLVFVEPPSSATLHALDGSIVRAPPIDARIAAGSADLAWVRLSHEQSFALGLPPRTAIAGIAELGARPDGIWRVVVVATARRERDREERGQWRVFIAFLLSSAIVIVFGTLALRRQRKELALAQRLALSEAVHARDEELVQADKLATLGAIAMGIAHQISTPLGVIVARANRLRQRLAEDPKSTKAADAISEQAHRIDEIVRAFLALARGGAPTLAIVEPGAVAQQAVELVRHRFEKAQVELVVHVADDAPPLACDVRLFDQAIVNLLLNGCEACSAGGRVSLEVRADETRVVFVVEDNGIGITRAEAARAVEPFFTTKPAGEGTGFGLAIANEIVRNHRGTLRLEPVTETRGTRATIEVPRAEVTP